MKSKRSIYGALAVIGLVMLACGAPTASPTQDKNLQGTVAAMAFQSTQQAMQMQATLAALSAAGTPTVKPTAMPDMAATQAALAAQNQQATAQAPAPATATPLPTEPPPPTAQPTEAGNLQATEQARPMAEEVQQLVKNTYIRSAEGIFTPLPNLDKTWYDDNEFAILNLDAVPHNLTNYVIRADMNWQVLGTLQDAAHTGCGFVYGYQDENNQHVSYMGMDSTVHTLRYRGVEKIEMKGGHYLGGMGQLGGEAKLLLLVDRQILHVFVNDVEVVTFKDPYLPDGRVGLAVFTGSLQGIRCQMKNVGVWELK